VRKPSAEGHEGMKKKSKIETSATESPASAQAPSFSERMKQHREKIRALGFKGPRASDMERFHRIVAGEE
jgi:hypothetical protein